MLAAEIRDFLVEKVSRTGGHLGPNLGVVELTLALHRVFDSPEDRILFDTGHQAYVHKIVTGARTASTCCASVGASPAIRARASPSTTRSRTRTRRPPCPTPTASPRRSRCAGEDRHVVAVVGDGALTGGMCWEALNNIAATDNPLVIVVNDNGRSYAPTIGGLADHLATLRLNPGYERVLDVVQDALGRTPLVGAPLFEALHAMKKGIKDAVAPQGMFEDLGLKYVGPVDGHDIEAVESALRRAKRFGGPVIVHAVTKKGYGYRPAEDDEADCLHGPGAFDPLTGKPLAAPSLKWTSVFADELVAIADERDGRRRHHGRDGRADRHRAPRRANTRSGRSTSASPNSTRSRPRPASRWAACTRSSRSTPRSSTARSTRCCSTSRCTSCRSRSCSTGPASPARTAQPLRHLGHVGLRRRARACGSPRPRRRDAARGAA